MLEENVISENWIDQWMEVQNKKHIPRAWW